jgi:hypothetical protein
MGMTIEWTKVAPVIVSILVIIGVAIARQYSRTLAAIMATMPINLPLALWIVYSGETNREAFSEFAGTMVINLLPTLLFIVVAWWLAKQGYTLVPIIGLSYVAWGVGLGLIFLVRHFLTQPVS